MDGSFVVRRGLRFTLLIPADHVKILLRVLGFEQLVDDPRFATRQARVTHAGFIRSTTSQTPDATRDR